MATNIVMPKVGGYDVQSAILVHWLKHEGDTLAAGDVVAEIESEKATVELPSPISGTLRRILVPEGTEVPVGAALAELAAAGENAVASPAANSTAGVPGVSEDEGRLKASPVARKLAAQWQIDLLRVQGTGPEGRITRDDVQRARDQQSVAAATTPTVPGPGPAAVAPTSVPTPQEARGVTHEPLSKMRQVIAHRMTQSATTVPHFVLVSEIDMGAALELRAELNALPEEPGISITDMVVRAAALALEQFPTLNSSYAGDQLLLHSSVNIGLAVMLETGLLTPVIHEANHRSLAEIACQDRRLIERARAGHLQPDDLSDGTFTISNLGMFDVQQFISIINPPEAAILAVATARDVVAMVNGQIYPRKRMNVALSVDHRVADGAQGAQFLQGLKALLESPLRLLI